MGSSLHLVMVCTDSELVKTQSTSDLSQHAGGVGGYHFCNKIEAKQKTKFPLVPTSYPNSQAVICSTHIMSRGHIHWQMSPVTWYSPLAGRPLACGMTRWRSRSFFEPTWLSYGERILEALSWAGRNKVPSNLAQRRGLCIIPKLSYRDDRQLQHVAKTLNLIKQGSCIYLIVDRKHCIFLWPLC